MYRKFTTLYLAVFVLLAPANLLGAERYSGGVKTRRLITQPVEEGRTKTLPGNTRSAAIEANDRGPVADSLPLEHMLLQLQRPPELEQELVDLIDGMHRPGSPVFQKWLTAAEFGRRFGVSPQDIEQITDWLTTHGFQVNSVYPNGMVIDFSGTAAQVREAFHTEIHNLEVNGEKHIANMRDPQIPAALAGAVKGVVSLHNFMPHANHHKEHPDFTVTSGGSTFQLVGPADLAEIYNLNPLYAAGISGQGETIAVIENSNLKNASDWSTFRTAFGLSSFTSGSFTQVNPSGPSTCTNPGVNGGEGEAAIDAEWASAAAPSANIVMASCKDTVSTFGGLIALQNLLAGASPPAIVSISYGECEADNGAAANAAWVSAYQQGAALGVSIFVAAGDSGAAGCDSGATATHGIAVSGFASTPYNVAVGATDFSDAFSGTVNTYWNATNSPVRETAKSYIPEIPSNSSCAGQVLVTSENFTVPYGASGFCNSTTGKNFRTANATSGGPSSFSAKPSYQSLLGNPADGHRDLPDISIFGARGLWGHALVFCMSDTAEGGATCDYTNPTDVLALMSGGTSFSAPIMAGIMALVNQKTGHLNGNPNPRLYAVAAGEYGATGSAACNSSLGNGAGSSCFFYDVTLGDTAVNCSGTLNCFGSSGSGATVVDGAMSTSSSTYQAAYGTTVGWDFATGIGSPNVYNLASAWDLSATTTVVTAGLNPSTYGAPVTLTATITSQTVPPVGTVTGTVSWSALTGCGTTPVTAGNPGVATCTTSVLPLGNTPIQASYSADFLHSTSTGTLAGGETVNKGTPVITWAQPAAIVYGGALGNGQLNATANVPGVFVYTPAAGTVLPAGSGQTLSVTFTPSDTTDYNIASGSTTITVNPAATPTPANLVVTKVLSRSGTVSVQLTLANNGGTAAANVMLNSVSVGGVVATPLPQSLGTIAAGGSVQATVSVPGSAGAPGAPSSLIVSGSYTGGTFNSSGRITLP